MFVYNTQDIVCGIIICLIIIWFIAKVIRYYYLKFRYRKCPCCGHATWKITETQQSFGDRTIYEKIYCRRKYDDPSGYARNKCDWEFKFQF